MPKTGTMTPLTRSLLERYLAKTPQQQQSSAAIAYLASLDYLQQTNPQIAKCIVQELTDQRKHLKLIASENYSSLAVQLSMGNLLTDKYAEGTAHHRFYAGCDNIDIIEDMAQKELMTLFKAEHAYVQPHSGADANLVAFWTILVQRIQNKELERLGKKTLDELTPIEYEAIRQQLVNQKVLGMSLNSGGHLTHGYKHNISSKMMQAFHYEVDPTTELLDYDALAKQAKSIKPSILLAGYSAYPRKLNFAKMREIADSIGATLMVDMAHFAGLVAGKAFTGDFNPIPFAHIVTSTTHKTLRGPRGGFVLCQKEYAATLDKGCPLVLGGPLPHVLAAKAIAFQEANSKTFCDYASQILNNSSALADQLIKRGVRLVTGGSENHMVILNISQFGLTGRQAELALREAHLTVNRNTVPQDQNGPWYTSGVRIGTAAITTLGMKQDEMRIIADIVVDVLKHTKPLNADHGQPSKAAYIIDPSALSKARNEIGQLLAKFPLYPEIDLGDQ